MNLYYAWVWTCCLFFCLCVGGIHDTDIPLRPTYVTKYIERCPEQGYFFKKDVESEATEVCYLCFCKANGTAVCWPRNNKRCNAESYQHNWSKKRVSRNRRSPLSFGNLFFADATRDALNSNGRTECKPHEASRSEGCPPVDWCVGCTVCDCNINGRWDCHLLSFCTDDEKKKKQSNKIQQTRRSENVHITQNSNVTRANRQMARKAVQQLAEKMAQERQKKKIGKSNTRRYFFKNGTLVNKTIFDLRKRKKSPTIINQNSAEIEKWNVLNMKIRKIPDNITKQMMFDKQQNNAKKVSESANFLVRKMPNKKTKHNIERKQAEAVNILAKRQPHRQKKRQVVLPPGFKIPKEMLDKIPVNLLPQRDPPGDHFLKKNHIKRVLPYQTAVTKPSRRIIPEKKQFKRSLELLSDLSTKVIVKRSTKSKDKAAHPDENKKSSNLQKAKPSKQIDKELRSLKTKSPKKTDKVSKSKRTDKISHIPKGKGPKKIDNVLKKVIRSNKAKTKKKSVNNSRNSYGIIHKNNDPKSNNKKISKDKTKKIDKRNMNNKKDLPNKKNKSLYNNGITRIKSNDVKSNNNKKNKVTKTNPMNKQTSRKNEKNNKDINSKNSHNDKNKNLRNNVNKKKNIGSKNRNVMHNKPLAKLIKSTNKVLDNYGLMVQEGQAVTKDTHRKVRSSPKNTKSTSKSSPKKPSPKDTLQIDRRQLNEEIKKLSGNIQTDLNRKVFEAVGRMIGQTLTPPTKKVKRSATLDQENISDEIVEDNVDFPTKLLIIPNTNWRYVDEEKQILDLPFLEFHGQKVKRSVTKDEKYNKSLLIPLILKNQTLSSDKLIENKEIDLIQLQKQNFVNNPSKNVDYSFPDLIHQTNLTTDSVPLGKKKENYDSDLIDIYVPIKRKLDKIYSTPKTTTIIKIDEAPIMDNTKKIIKSAPKAYEPLINVVNMYIMSSAIKNLIGQKVKRSAPIMKKVILKKSIYEKQKKKSLTIPFTKSQKVSVEKSNKVKVYRHKRNTDEKQSAIINLEDVENEISAKSLKDVLNITKPSKLVETTDSVFKYYKYTIDDILNDNIKSTDKKYSTEIVEVYTKNGAAKRSVDRQIEVSPNLGVLQISSSDSNNETVSVRGLDEKNESISNVFSNENKNLTILDNDDRLKVIVHAGEFITTKPMNTNILDDKVVIIEEQNTSSIKHFTELIPNFIPTPSKTNALKSSSVNITVIGVKKLENTSTENPNKVNELFTKKPKETIEYNSSTVIDKTIVIINEQNNTPMSTTTTTTTSPLKSTTKYKNESDNITKVEDHKELPTIEIGNRSSSNDSDVNFRKQNSEPVTLKVVNITKFVNVSKEALPVTNTEYIHKLKGNNNTVFVRENELLTHEVLSELKEDRNRYTTTITTTEQMKNEVISIAKPIVKNSLKYEVGAKTYNLTQNSTQTNLQKDTTEKKKQEEITINGIKNSKPNNRIENYLYYVEQKDPYAKIKEISNNNTISRTIDLKMKNDTFLNVLTSNNIKQNNLISNTTMKTIEDNNWINQTTLKTIEQISTTQVNNNVYKNIVSLPKETINNNSPKNILKSNDIKKINVKKAKKHKLKKLLTTLHNKKNKDERYLVNDDTKHKVKDDTKYKDKVKNHKSENKTNDLKSFFRKLLSGFKFNKHARKPYNVKRFKILKYLQKFFKKIFTDDGKHKKNKTNKTQLNRKNVIDTLCSTFGPCNINIKNKAKLQSQIDHLNSETYKMLRSVKIIKGLLKLVDMAKNDKKITNGTAKTAFKNDVHKLHAILKDTYSNGEQLDKLTETQKIQIQYIKNSTQNFIQSAAKFTMVLNEIINVITVPEHKKIKKDHYQPKVKISDKPDTKKVLKSRNVNETVTLTESNVSLQKLKELVSKYSLLQNTFMRKIYNVLTNLDSRESTQNKNRIDSSQAIKNTDVQNKTEEIQVYTKNIIQNLRKLKNLAQNLNGNVRRKRDLRNDDSFEYMLMLMEYLLKQQKPLDSPPVNDGIDLLIEAIKSAPDIKPIKNKNLPVYNHRRKLDYRVQATTAALETRKLRDKTKESKYSYSESDSKPSKEDNDSSSDIFETKFNVVEQSLDDDDGDDEDYFMSNKRANVLSKVETHTTSKDRYTIKYKHENVVTEPYYQTSSKGKANTKHKLNGGGSNEFFFNKDVEDEVTPTNAVSEFEYTTITTPETLKLDMTTKITTKTPHLQMTYYKGDDDVSSSKSRIDWLDETYEEEIKEESRKYSSTTEKSTKHTKSDKTMTERDRFNNSTKPTRSNDISGLSREIDDVPKKGTTREILYKKELDLLNSLDYGTEKTEADMSGSRESGAIDKYSGDAFAPYYREERIK